MPPLQLCILTSFLVPTPVLVSSRVMNIFGDLNQQKPDPKTQHASTQTHV